MTNINKNIGMHPWTTGSCWTAQISPQLFGLQFMHYCWLIVSACRQCVASFYDSILCLWSDSLGRHKRCLFRELLLFCAVIRQKTSAKTTANRQKFHPLWKWKIRQTSAHIGEWSHFCEPRCGRCLLCPICPRFSHCMSQVVSTRCFWA